MHNADFVVKMAWTTGMLLMFLPIYMLQLQRKVQVECNITIFMAQIKLEFDFHIELFS